VELGLKFFHGFSRRRQHSTPGPAHSDDLWAQAQAYHPFSFGSGRLGSAFVDDGLYRLIWSVRATEQLRYCIHAYIGLVLYRQMSEYYWGTSNFGLQASSLRQNSKPLVIAENPEMQTRRKQVHRFNSEFQRQWPLSREGYCRSCITLSHRRIDSCVYNSDNSVSHAAYWNPLRVLSPITYYDADSEFHTISPLNWM
jgi:hypothetical protein